MKNQSAPNIVEIILLAISALNPNIDAITRTIRIIELILKIWPFVRFAWAKLKAKKKAKAEPPPPDNCQKFK